MTNRKTAILLAILGGTFGIQKFYTKRYFLGILMILFSFTGIPFIVGMIDALSYASMSEDQFNFKFFNIIPRSQKPSYETHYDQSRNRRKMATQPETWRNYEKGHPRQPDSSTSKINNKAEKRRKESLSHVQKILKHREEGVKYYRNYEFEQARREFLNVLEFEIQDIPSYFNLACIETQLGNHSDAFMYLSKATNYGFKNFDKLESHEALAPLRVLPFWEEFRRSGYQVETDDIPLNDSPDLIEQIKQHRKEKEEEQSSLAERYLEELLRNDGNDQS